MSSSGEGSELLLESASLVLSVLRWWICGRHSIAGRIIEAGRCRSVRLERKAMRESIGSG